jgi:hypothetical protein
VLRLPVVFYLAVTFISHSSVSLQFCQLHAVPTVVAVLVFAFLTFFSTVPIMSILALCPVPTVLGWFRFGVKELYGSVDVPSWPLC